MFSVVGKYVEFVTLLLTVFQQVSVGLSSGLYGGKNSNLMFGLNSVRYSGAGHPAYHPRILVKVLVQAMLDRVRFSRVIARNVRENVVFLYLAEKLTPDFRTISDFRKNNEGLLKDIFKTTVSVAKELGAVGLEHLSIDGSKLKASASNNSTVTKEELDVIEKYVNNELKEGIGLDRVEDEQFKDYRGYDQLKETSKKKIKALIAKYIRQVNKDNYDRVSEIKDTVKKAKDELEDNELDKVSLTDPESRFMKNKKGRIEYSYNPQITTDDKLNLIVANDVCQDPFDVNNKTKQNIIGKFKFGRVLHGANRVAFDADPELKSMNFYKELNDEEFLFYTKAVKDWKFNYGFNINVQELRKKILPLLKRNKVVSRIVYKDDMQLRLVFSLKDKRVILTNDFKSKPSEVYNYYVKRWKIETSFREEKQNLGLETLPTRKLNGIKIHFLLCILAYILSQFIIAKTKIAEGIKLVKRKLVKVWAIITEKYNKLVLEFDIRYKHIKVFYKLLETLNS